MKFYPTFILLAFLITLQGCFSVKPNSQKSTQKLIETFFVGEEGTQYFIKPFSFENKETNENLLVDFSFRYKDKIAEKDSAVLNISIVANGVYKKLDRFVIEKNDLKVLQEKTTLLFNERKKDLFVSRFTTHLSLLDIQKLFDSNDWKIEIKSKQKNMTFYPSKRTTKAIEGVKNEVFVLMGE